MQIQVELETLTACPICGSDDIAERKQGRMSICQLCGQWFNNPRMTDDYTAKYYRGIYRDLTLSGDHNNKHDEEMQLERSAIQGEIIAQYCKPKSHLEIGCSRGYLLEEMHKRGIPRNNSVGVEPDSRFYSTPPANQYRIVGDISELEPQIFDLISMSHSLEHINHPVEYLENLINNYAKPGTLIMAEVPNSAMDNCTYLVHHPLAYNQITLIQLFERCACKVIITKAYALGRRTKDYLLGIFEAL